MAGFGDAIKYLYEKFILRDVLSFVTPGAIIVLTAVFLFYRHLLDFYIPWSFYIPIPWPFYIPLFGLFFMVGFAVQCLGEFLGLVQFRPGDRYSLRSQLNFLRWNWDESKKVKEIREQLVKDYRDWAKLTEEKEITQRERLVVLKQMCGNGFLAAAIAGILFAFSFVPWKYINICTVSLVGAFLLGALYWSHRVHVLRQTAWQEAVISLQGGQKKES